VSVPDLRRVTTVARTLPVSSLERSRPAAEVGEVRGGLADGEIRISLTIVRCDLTASIMWAQDSVSN